MIGSLINAVNEKRYQLEGEWFQAPSATETHAPVARFNAFYAYNAKSDNQVHAAKDGAFMVKG